MLSRLRGVFSLRGSKTPPWYVTVAFVALAFAVGLGTGWLTGFAPTIAGWFEPAPSASVVPSIVVSTSPAPDVPVGQFPAIVRPLDADDSFAGLTSLDIPIEMSGPIVPLPGEDPPAETGLTRWVRIEVEDGLPINGDALSPFVMDVLNDPRGWGASGAQTFARTEGAAEVRIVFVTPQTAAALCDDVHAPFVVETETVTDVRLPDLAASASPTEAGAAGADEVAPTPGPSAPAVATRPSCANKGLVVINAYYWAAGVFSFPDNRTDGRAWMIEHFLGHVRGLPDATCDGKGKQPVATVMVDHAFDIAPCAPQPWPFPDAEVDEQPDA